MPYLVGYTPYTPNIQIKHWKSYAQLGSVNRFALCTFWDVCIPHKLRDKNSWPHIPCNSLLKWKKNPFLKQIVTGNENWILYNNVEWKRSWGIWNEPHQPHKGWSSFKEGDTVHVVGLEGSPLLWPPCGKPNNSNKYYYQLINWKQHLTKTSRISQQKTHYLPSG